MNELKRAIPLVLVHLILAAVACFLNSFLSGIPEGLIAPFVLGYRIRSALLSFTGLIPALCISGILLGYSIAFGKFPNHGTARWSHELFSALQGAFILSLVSVSFYIILAEGFSPFMESKLQQMEIMSADYSANIALAEEFCDSDAYSEAELHANAALQIWPKSDTATQLLNRIRYDAADSHQSSLPASDVDISAVRSPGAANLTVLDAIARAETYTEEEDYFSAHYFAMLAYKLAKDTDPNKQIALRTAADAWNHISNMPDSREARSSSRVFSLKRQGYDAIQREDWLSAYYIFASLQEEDSVSEDGLYDPDVERLFEVARQGLSSAYFFIDETIGIEPFEAARDVFFIVKHDDGSTSVVFFRGIAYKRESGLDMAYLRGFEYAFFDIYKECKFRISVPYVKMLPYRNSDSRMVPQFLLHSVDRRHSGVDTIPEIHFGSMNGTMQNVLLLDMPYEDLHLVIAADRGIPSMTLADLIKFADKAGIYGFSGDMIQGEIVYRLTQPFLILILSVIALIAAWRFRFRPNMLFKAWWILFVPAVPAVCWYAVDSARYFVRLVSIPVVAFFPSFPVPVMLCACALAFIGTSLTFFGQRGD